MRPSLTFWVLLAFIGFVLYALVVPKFGSDRGQARVTAAYADINGGIKVALDLFRVETGSYPAGSNGLLELVQQPVGATNWHGPYLRDLPVDPWGNKFFYEYPGKHIKNGYDLSSTGRDGKPGTEDDIVNW